MKKDSSKLVLNIGTEYLNQLFLDTNGEIKIEIKNGIIQNFTRNHLKGIMTKEVMKEVSKDIVSKTRDEIMQNYFGSYLKETIQHLIKQYVEETIEIKMKKVLLQQIKNVIMDQLAMKSIPSLIEKIIKDSLNEQYEEFKQQILKKLNE